MKIRITGRSNKNMRSYADAGSVTTDPTQIDWKALQAKINEGADASLEGPPPEPVQQQAPAAAVSPQQDAINKGIVNIQRDPEEQAIQDRYNNDKNYQETYDKNLYGVSDDKYKNWFQQKWGYHPPSKDEQAASDANKISDNAMKRTFGNPYSLYNLSKFAGNIVDGINNRRDRRETLGKQWDNTSTMGMFGEQGPDVTSRGIRAVSGTQRNKDIPDQISGYNSWQGMTQKYFNPFRAEVGLSVDNVYAPGATMAEFTPSMPMPVAGDMNQQQQQQAPIEDDNPPVVTGAKFESSPDFKELIAAKESGGNYRALPLRNGHLVSSAAGKYQFLWSQHKEWISKLTGVTSKEDFLNSPEAQEKAFDYWDANTLTPAAIKIKNELGVNDSLDKIKTKVHFSGPQGAYNFYKTGKLVTDGFGTTTATYANGGEINNNGQSMKIRITSTPLNQMAYGGQANFGLDLNRRKIYADMPQDSTESMSSTVTEKPVDQFQDGEQYAIMAEDKETYVSDVDGDGVLEFKKISGDPHSASSGGTKLTNLQLNPDPEKNGQGAYIFSHKLKEKDAEVLKKFTMPYKKAGYSYAEISKKFDTSKEKKALDNPNTDALTKNTMNISMQRKNDMLAQLSDRQEQIKGYPQGQPDIYKSLATAAYGGYTFGGGGGKDNNKQPGLGQYRKRTPELNDERSDADFGTVDDVVNFYKRQGYTGGNDIGEWQNWMVEQAQSDPYKRERLINYLKGVPLTNKGRQLYGQNASTANLTEEQLMNQFRDGKWDFRAPKFYNPATIQGVKIPYTRQGIDFPVKTPPTIPGVPQFNTPPPQGKTNTPPPGRPNDYLPYNAIQKANTLWAATRPVNGYFDRAINPNLTGQQAMFDEANYDPMLSANNTRMDYMNQFANAQAARATGTYNPQLNEGLVGETARVRGMNLQIGNQTLAQNNQIYNNDSLMRAKEAHQVRDNNIRTKEQMDIARNLKYNDVMKNFGKMVNDRTTMQKYNLMYPQFAVSGPLWDQFNFTKGRPLGSNYSGTGYNSMMMSKEEFLKNNKGYASAYASSDPKLQMDVENAYQRYLSQQRNMLMRSGANLQSNMTSPWFSEAMDYGQ